MRERERQRERQREGVRERGEKQIDTDTATTQTYVVTDTKQKWVNRSDSDKLTGFFNRNSQENRFRDEVKFECYDKREET